MEGSVSQLAQHAA